MILQEQFKTWIQLRKSANEVNWKVYRENDLMHNVLIVASSWILAYRIYAELFWILTEQMSF